MLLAMWYAFKVANKRYKAQLGSQRARWDSWAQTVQQFTVAESFTLGWLNVMLRHLWPTIMEKELSEKLGIQLQVRLMLVTGHRVSAVATICGFGCWGLYCVCTLSIFCHGQYRSHGIRFRLSRLLHQIKEGFYFIDNTEN